MTPATSAARSRSFHLSRLRRWLAGSPSSSGGVFREQARRFTVAQGLTRGFYAFLLYIAVSPLNDNLPTLLGNPPGAPLWPVAWLGWTHHSALGPRALMAFYLATNILGVFFASSRVSRALTFLGLLEFLAYKNSFGKIGHSFHLVLLVAGVLILLPDGWTRPAPRVSRRCRQETLLVFWLAQATVLLSYTMSGAAKLAAALFQLGAGQPNAFAPGGLSAIIAERLTSTHSTSYLGGWIVGHPYLTWPALPVVMYLELCALFVAFRPSLVRPWALLLIVFHVGTYITMTIIFQGSCFLLALLFLASPFEPDPAPTWRRRLLDIPGMNQLYKLWQTARRRRGVVYSR